MRCAKPECAALVPLVKPFVYSDSWLHRMDSDILLYFSACDFPSMHTRCLTFSCTCQHVTLFLCTLGCVFFPVCFLSFFRGFSGRSAARSLGTRPRCVCLWPGRRRVTTGSGGPLRAWRPKGGGPRADPTTRMPGPGEKSRNLGAEQPVIIEGGRAEPQAFPRTCRAP